jgi:hypothetical protein
MLAAKSSAESTIVCFPVICERSAVLELMMTCSYDKN